MTDTSMRRREPRGIPAGGQYAAEHRGEGDVKPLTTANPDSDSIEDSPILSDYLDEQVERYGPGMRDSVMLTYNMMPNNNARELYVRSRTGVVPQTGYSSRTREHLEPNEATKLDALGYTADDVQALARYDTYTITRHEIPPNIVRALHDRGLGNSVLSSAYTIEALTDREHTDQVEAAIRDENTTMTHQIVRASNPEHADRLVRGAELDLRVNEIEQGYDLETHAALAEALKTKRWDAGRIMDNGHDVASFKKYGANLAHEHKREDLEASGLKPAPMRSLHTKGVRDLGDMKTLIDAGLTKGADYAQVRDAASDNSTKADAAKTAAVYEASGKNAEALTAYRASVRAAISVSDAGHIKNLVERGYDDPNKLRELTAKNFTVESSRHSTEGFSRPDMFQTYDDLTKANISPERIGAMSRAGIAPQDMAKHANDKDLWKAGEPYRKRYEEGEVSASKWSGREPKKWPFDRKGNKIGETADY